ncbi:MAG TPA: hypothetical protein VK633_08635 [Verrucomicrobiae bacterium]|nr:hypothetical protein [Verrucomicrobiae bacterium]
MEKREDQIDHRWGWSIRCYAGGFVVQLAPTGGINIKTAESAKGGGLDF